MSNAKFFRRCLILFAAGLGIGSGVVGVTAEAAPTTPNQLSAIDVLLQQGKHKEAISLAIREFALDDKDCKAIEIKDLKEAPAKTGIDQVVRLNPKREALKNARFLVPTLAHELTHCQQNQSLYEIVITKDNRLASLRGKVTKLKNLQASVKDRELVNNVLEDIVGLHREMGELIEMEAANNAFKLQDVLVPPKSPQETSREFAFQYRSLMISTAKFLRYRKLMGIEKKDYCKNLSTVPMPLNFKYEASCQESVSLLLKYFDYVPS